MDLGMADTDSYHIMLLYGNSVQLLVAGWYNTIWFIDRKLLVVMTRW